MTDVFISYKKEDAPRVEPIARALANAGYDVWWDHRIPAGRTYRDVIGAALQTAKCVIVVWSKLSANAQWVLDEADEGKRRNVLLPLLIDEVDVPYGFRQIEAARLIGWAGDPNDGEWQNALSAVEHFVGRAPGGAPKPLSAQPLHVARSSPAASEPSPRRRQSMLMPLVGLAALLLAGGGYFAWQSGMIGANGAAAPADIAADGADEAASAPTAPAEEPNVVQAEAPPQAEPPRQQSAPPVVESPRQNAALGTTEGLTRLTLNMGPHLVREASGTWVEVDPSTGRSSYRWTESRRTPSVLELRDAGRDATMRIALNESWVYLYFPDWGEFRRQWSIAGVERAAPQAQTFACYWLSNDANPTWRPMSHISTRRQCFEQDSCDGGLGRSNGGCYKWAAGPNAPRQPW